MLRLCAPSHIYMFVFETYMLPFRNLRRTHNSLILMFACTKQRIDKHSMIDCHIACVSMSNSRFSRKVLNNVVRSKKGAHSSTSNGLQLRPNLNTQLVWNQPDVDHSHHVQNPSVEWSLFSCNGGTAKIWTSRRCQNQPSLQKYNGGQSCLDSPMSDNPIHDHRIL